MYREFWLENLNGRDHLEREGNTEMYLNRVGGCGMDLFGLDTNQWWVLFNKVMKFGLHRRRVIS
jgi:hypothetical protein